VAGIVGILCGRKYAWFGPIVLALLPRFWGHSFFNFKDIPFAALFIFSIYTGAYLVTRYLKVDQNVKIGVNYLTICTILYGILIGLLSGLRIGGVVVLFFVLIAYIVGRLTLYSFPWPKFPILTTAGGLGKFHCTILKRLKLWGRRIYIEFVHIGVFYVLMVVVWFATTFFVHPMSWSNPFEWLSGAIANRVRYPLYYEMIFDGQFVSSQALPWTYLPTWMLITIPVIVQISFVLGAILILTKYARFSGIQRTVVVLLFLQIFFLPIFAIVKNSTLYTGMRHFLFVLPGIASISAAAFLWLYQKLPRKNIRVLALVSIVLAFAPILLNMIELHPYEYVYFNRAFGGLNNAYNRYETDYWGLSMREAMEWINENDDTYRKIVVGGAPADLARTFADFDVDVTDTIVDYSLEETGEFARPYYYLAMPHPIWSNVFPECKVVYQVVRQGVPLTKIKYCVDRTVAVQGGDD
jgi:hypothetical protein